MPTAQVCSHVLVSWPGSYFLTQKARVAPVVAARWSGPDLFFITSFCGAGFEITWVNGAGCEYLLVEAMELDGDKTGEIAGSLPLLRLSSGVIFVLGRHPTVAVWRLCPDRISHVVPAAHMRDCCCRLLFKLTLRLLALSYGRTTTRKEGCGAVLLPLVELA